MNIQPKGHINEATGNQNPQFEKINLIEYAWKQQGQDLDVMFIGQNDSLEQISLKDAEGNNIKDSNGITKTIFQPGYDYFKTSIFNNELDILDRELFEKNMVKILQKNRGNKLNLYFKSHAILSFYLLNYL